MRLLALSGSLRAASTNTAVREASRLLAPAGVDIVPNRGLAALPHFNPDDHEDAPPPAVAALRAEVRASAGLVIAIPEYAHGVPGALKNALDWLVSSDAIPCKPVVPINAAPRAFHAQSALREILSTMAARLVADAFVTLPLPGGVIDAGAVVGDPRFSGPLRKGLSRFVAAIVA